MVADLRVGCSGWDYDGWQGSVYPEDLPRSEWFGHYADRFDTVEINNTFYQLPSEEKIRHWKERAPKGFRYSAKLSRYGSHNKKLKDPEEWVSNFTDRVDGLGARLGAVLVQLPPNWKADPGRLDEFLAAAPGRHRWAVEMRDPSWLTDDVYDVLSKHGAALCIHDMLDDHPREITSDWVYVRYHGPNAPDDPYRGAYPHQKLTKDAEWLAGLLDDGIDVYAYFNNDAEADAPDDAERLRDLIQKHRST